MTHDAPSADSYPADQQGILPVMVTDRIWQHHLSSFPQSCAALGPSQVQYFSSTCRSSGVSVGLDLLAAQQPAVSHVPVSVACLPVWIE